MAWRIYHPCMSRLVWSLSLTPCWEWLSGPLHFQCLKWLPDENLISPNSQLSRTCTKCFLIDDRRSYVVDYEWIWTCLMGQWAMSHIFNTQRSMLNFNSNEIKHYFGITSISTLQRRYLLRSCSAVLSSFHSRGVNDCQAVTKPDLFPKQSGHFGQEFDMSDNLIALFQQSSYSWDLSHRHLGLCY